MKKLFTRLIWVLHILALPISAHILNNSRRVRVVVRFKDAILLERSYLGHQLWSLPGGGVEKHETLQEAAVRETREETGIVITGSQLRMLGQQRLGTGLPWTKAEIHFLLVELSEDQQPTVSRPLEIIEAAWWPLDRLPAKASPTVKVGLDYATKHLS